MKKNALIVKIVLLGLLVIGISSTLKAQDDQSGEETSSTTSFSYGFKAGTNFHSFTDQQPHTSGKIGYSAGIFGKYSFGSVVSLQMEAAYFQQGGEYVQFIDESRYGAPVSYDTKHVKEASVTLHNVYVPLQAHLSFFDKSYLPDLLIGPYMDVNFAATENYEKTGQVDSKYVTTVGSDVVTDQYEMLQFGATAGLSFNVPTSKDFSFLFDVSYKYGIFPVKESYSYIDYYGVTGDISSNALSVTVGLKF
jgi:hypothetical protein